MKLRGYFWVQPVLYNWYNIGRDMYYPIYGTVHIKDPLLLIGKTDPDSVVAM